MFASSGARPHGGVKAGRHLAMIICDSGALAQSLRRVIRVSVVDAAEGLPRFASVEVPEFGTDALDYEIVGAHRGIGGGAQCDVLGGRRDGIRDSDGLGLGVQPSYVEGLRCAE